MSTAKNASCAQYCAEAVRLRRLRYHRNVMTELLISNSRRSFSAESRILLIRVN